LTFFDEIKKNLSKNYRKYLTEKITEEDFIETEKMIKNKIIQLKE
jgi:CRISPR/Cas system endoribonuclease Cas6 (RAMP superfamily)